jgi:hypothetical protein
MPYRFEDEFPITDDIWNYSNPRIVQNRASKFYRTTVYRSTLPSKKYMIYDPIKRKWIHFGQMYYEDYTKHKDEDRRYNYLRRSQGIKGDWRDNIYSPNNLSRLLLW